MTNLTPEQIADGWKPISKIVNEPDAGVFQILEPRLHGAFKEHPATFSKRDLELYFENYAGKVIFYRRLVPALPNQVVISREDARFAANMLALLLAQYEANPNGEYYIKMSSLINDLRAKLEGK